MQLRPQKINTTSKEYVVRVSPNGQITLPKAIRSKLGLITRDKVTIRLERGEVRVTPVKATLESVYQSVPALKRKLADKEIAHIAKEDHAQEAAKKGYNLPCLD